MDNEEKKVSNDLQSLLTDKLSGESVIKQNKKEVEENSLKTPEQSSENINSKNTITLEPKNYVLLSEAFYEGSIKRVVAYFIDIIVVGLGIVGIFNTLTQNKLNNKHYSLIFNGEVSYSFIIVYFIYFIGMTFIFSQTLGKMIIGMKVEHSEGKKLSFIDVLFRETIGRILTMLLFNLPYLLIIFDKRKRGLHDYIGNTVTVKSKFSSIRKDMNMKLKENKKGK